MKTQILTLFLLVTFSTCFAVAKTPAFITTWETETDNDSITIYTNVEFKTDYKYHIDWGDGYAERNLTGDATHTYAKAGDYIVKITGDFPAIYSDAKYSKNASKLQTIENWGNIKWQSMEKAFYGCNTLKYMATDIPNLKKVTNMREMFVNAKNFNGDISKWNVKNVIKMDYMFSGATSFNQNISNWNVSNAWSMDSMFEGATSFNQDIGGWDVRFVRSMTKMFADCTVFNQDISSWDVSNVIKMFSMFKGASSFNQDIGGWDVSNVINMRDMFNGAQNFNQDLSNWDTDNVTVCKNFDINSKLSAKQLPKVGDGFSK